jgi:hypothetical protein
MTRHFALAALLTAALGTTGTAADVAGHWTLTMRFLTLDVTSTGICEFAQDAATLSGWCGGPGGDGAFDVTGESAAGDAVAFRFVDTDGAVRMRFTGALEGGEMRGSCLVIDGNACTFTATRP